MALDHTGSMMFARNYLSRILRYSTENAYWGRTPDNDLAKAASRFRIIFDNVVDGPKVVVICHRVVSQHGHSLPAVGKAKLLGGLGLGSIAESLGLGGGKKKK